MKTVQLYGETFEVKHSRYPIEEVYATKWNYASIYDAYQNPSYTKRCIWDFWWHFGLPIDETQPYHVGVPFIKSRNCFKFTVTFNVYDMKTREFAGVAVVTADHNYLYLKED